MCGIYCCVCKDGSGLKKPIEDELQAIKRRGPDNFACKSFQISNPHGHDTFIQLASSVLHIRGDQVIKQPISNDDQTLIFQWNGEMYRSTIDTLNCDFENIHRNDGLVIFDWLQCNSEIIPNEFDHDSNPIESKLIRLMSESHGEYAFILIDLIHQCIWFARDFFGRRSLCWNANQTLCKTVNELIQNSNAKGDWLNAGHIEHIQLCSVLPDHYKSIDWCEVPAFGLFRLSFTCKHMQLDLIKWHSRSESIDCQPSTDNLLWKPFANEFNQIDLIAPEIAVLDQQLNQAVHTLTNHLSEAVRVRIANQKSIGILFSGGLDCTVLALLADQHLNVDGSIYLLNIAFDTNTVCPDRSNALKSLHDLKRLRPDRQWNFIPVDCDRHTLTSVRHSRINQLISPKNTVLDDSIGCALWFAASGSRPEIDINLIANRLQDNYSAEGAFRVLLVGMGADEQLAGYSRHWAAHARGGLIALSAEMAYDVLRISDRNLGRDDRVLADHALEARFPFLDEIVVNYLNSLPVYIKCDLNLPKGVGDKKLLRTLAKQLDLLICSQLPKKAIQFGSRIAKLEQRNERASDICDRLV